MHETRDRLVNCFALVFPEMPAEGIPRAAITSVEDWDSTATVTLLGVVEEEFDLSFEPEEIENFDRFGSILDLVSRRLA